MDILFPRSTVESQAEVWTHRPTDPPTHHMMSNPTQLKIITLENTIYQSSDCPTKKLIFTKCKVLRRKKGPRFYISCHTVVTQVFLYI